jgi:hypothetical protein
MKIAISNSRTASESSALIWEDSSENGVGGHDAGGDKAAGIAYLK